MGKGGGGEGSLAVTVVGGGGPLLSLCELVCYLISLSKLLSDLIDAY